MREDGAGLAVAGRRPLQLADSTGASGRVPEGGSPAGHNACPQQLTPGQNISIHSPRQGKMAFFQTLLISSHSSSLEQRI